MKCTIHTEFFEDTCSACRQEYRELKQIDEGSAISNKKYKDFTEERAKKLYEELLLQYLSSGASEAEANQKAKAIIKKQCNLRRMPFWSWL